MQPKAQRTRKFEFYLRFLVKLFILLSFTFVYKNWNNNIVPVVPHRIIVKIKGIIYYMKKYEQLQIPKALLLNIRLLFLNF